MIEKVIKSAQSYFPDINRDRVRTAYKFAKKAHGKQKRKDGSPYITHPVSAALILTDLHVDEDTLIACLLHDVPEDTERTLEDVEDNFGESVRFLVEGITKLSKVHYRNDMEERQIESLKKLFIHTAQDPRIILIKLADRLHNMNTIEAVGSEKQVRIAGETLEIFVPIAKLLGVWDLKSQLEDLCFKVLCPEEYSEIERLVQFSRFHDGDIVDRNTKTVAGILKKNSISYMSIEGRQKAYFSIYKKMKYGKKSFSEIYDLVGLRVIVKNVEDCYKMLGFLHQNFTPKIGRLKDYIAIPKANGYQSIHTTIFGIDATLIECQIRSYDMHLENEYGIAAHFFYSKGQKKRDDMKQKTQKKYKWVEEILDMQRGLKNSNKTFLKNLKLDVFKDRIFVFTPKGDVVDLPKGSTVIDFAYYIHSDIGMLASSAQVNGQPAAVLTKLRSGDVVKVQTSEGSEGPKLEWLEKVQSTLARTRIREYLKEKDRSSLIGSAEKILDERLKFFGMDGIKALSKAQQILLIKHFGLEDWESLLFDLGTGSIDILDIIYALYTGQDLFGAKFDTMHKRTTQNLSEKVHHVRLCITIQDRVGILAEITKALDDLEINILQINTFLAEGEAVVRMEFLLEIDSIRQYEKCFSNLSRIKGVRDLVRRQKTELSFEDLSKLSA